MKNILKTIIEENNYKLGKNHVGITIDMLIDGAIDNNLVEHIRNKTNCSKDAITRVIRNTFPDKKPSANLLSFLLRKWGLKNCPKCAKTKDIENFYKSSIRPDGLNSLCKECSKEARISSYDKDPGKELVKNYVRKDRMLTHQQPIWANESLIKEFYLNRPEGHHVDHIIPLNGKLVSGLHVENNLQYLPAQENLKKKNNYEI